MEGTYEFSEVFEIFDACEGFGCGTEFCAEPAEVDGKYGVRLFTADFPVAVGVEIIEYVSSENRVGNRASVPKDLGIRSPLSVLAGNGCGGICENRQNCDGEESFHGISKVFVKNEQFQRQI